MHDRTNERTNIIDIINESIPYRFPSNYTSEEGDNEDPVHTYAMAENVLDIVVSLITFYHP